MSCVAQVQKIEEYAVGETVLGDWKGRGKMFQGRVTAVGNHDHTNAAFRTYTVEYEDGDCETMVRGRDTRQASHPVCSTARCACMRGCDAMGT